MGRTRIKYCVILACILLIAIVVALMVGAEPLNIFTLDENERSIFLNIRMPRVFLAVGVGASLAVAGAGLQSMLRNPLAEPYLLGVSNGAALGVLVGFVLFSEFEFARPILAFLGAVTASIVVFTIAKGRAGMTVERLVLSGVIVTTFLSSLIVMLTTVLDATRLRSYTFWLLGDLSQATTGGILLSIMAALFATFMITSQSRALNLMMIGERDAGDFGVEVSRVRLAVFGAASVAVGSAVAASGSVGYVGLIVPHLVRLAIGSDNRLVIPLSAIAGAAFVVLADVAARTIIAPRELPIGAITALIGAPIFIYLLRRN